MCYNIWYFFYLEFNITELDILNLYNKQNGNCSLQDPKSVLKLIHFNIVFLSGENLTIKANLDNGKLNRYNISIDRIDSLKGYTVDNILLTGAIILNDIFDSRDSNDDTK